MSGDLTLVGDNLNEDWLFPQIGDIPTVVVGPVGGVAVDLTDTGVRT